MNIYFLRISIIN